MQLQEQDLQRLYRYIVPLLGAMLTLSASYIVYGQPYLWRVTTTLILGTLLTLETLIYIRKLHKEQQGAIEHPIHKKDKLERFETLAHELRTPLTSIRGSLALILAGTTNSIPEDLKALLKIAYRNALRMINITDKLLDEKGIHTEDLPLVLEKHSLNHLIKGTIQESIFYQEAYQIQFNFHSDVQDDLVQMDKDKMRVVVENLLANAAKYTKKDDVVDVHVQKKGDWIQVSVTDHGPGISPEFQENIFKRYSRERNASKKGLGIGLNICKRIIEMHGGHIGFKSTANQETTFYFELKKV